MKINELRIGNWVKRNLPTDMTYAKVLEIIHNGLLVQDKDGYVGCSMNFIEPIELTEELLYKIGFCFGGVSGYGKHYVKTNGNDTLWCKIYESGNMSLTCNNNANLIQLHKVKFLHQLQNAHYLLTNEELEVKL